MPTLSVDLTDHQEHFIENGIASGRFSNAGDMIREGLRLVEERENEDSAKLERLRAAARDSFASIDRGEGAGFESMDELEAYIHRIGEEVSAETAAERVRGRKKRPA